MNLPMTFTASQPFTYIDSECSNRHQHKPCKPRSKVIDGSKSARVSTKLKTAGPLDWLGTNRQIYSEAQPIVYGNLSLLICDVLNLSAFMSQSPETIIKPSMVRSLSFCIKLQISSDLLDGFSFGYADTHKWQRRGNACMCPWCFAAGGEILANAAETFTALRELRLRIYVCCAGGAANIRPVIGHYANGRARHGLYAMVC